MVTCGGWAGRNEAGGSLAGDGDAGKRQDRDGVAHCSRRLPFTGACFHMCLVIFGCELIFSLSTLGVLRIQSRDASLQRVSVLVYAWCSVLLLFCAHAASFAYPWAVPSVCFSSLLCWARPFQASGPIFSLLILLLCLSYAWV